MLPCNVGMIEQCGGAERHDGALRHRAVFQKPFDVDDFRAVGCSFVMCGSDQAVVTALLPPPHAARSLVPAGARIAHR
jgi:hypothetical protein